MITPLDHPLLEEKPLTLEAIARYPIVTYDFAFDADSPVKRAFDARSIKTNVALTAADADVIKAYVERGVGVGILEKMAYDPARDTRFAADRRKPAVRPEHDAHRTAPERLPSPLRLRLHRNVRAAPFARGGRENDARPRHRLRAVIQGVSARALRRRPRSAEGAAAPAPLTPGGVATAGRGTEGAAYQFIRRR